MLGNIIKRIFLNVPLFILITSVVALVFAYISEYMFDLLPCNLCYYQRYVYMSAILTSISAILLSAKNKLFILFSILSILIILVGAGVAFFHMGVEYKWFEQLSGCEGDINYLDNIKLGDFSDAGAVPCDKPQFEFILSMAGWNFIISLLIAIYTFIIFIKFRK